MRLRILALIAALICQSCLYESGGDAPSGNCGAGTYQYTRFQAYDARDSLLSIFIVREHGDTAIQQFFAYDSAGDLVRNVWIDRQTHPQGDTVCTVLERMEQGATIRSTDCADTARIVFLRHLDEQGRPERTEYFSAYPLVDYEVLVVYNDKGWPARFLIRKDGRQFVVEEVSYDESGQWTEYLEFDENGYLQWRTLWKKAGNGRSTTWFLDADGNVVGWEANFLNSRNKVDKSVACSAYLASG